VLVLSLCLVIIVIIVDAGSDTAVGCREYCAGEEVRSTVVSLPAAATYGVKELCEPASPASSDYMNKIRKRLNDDATARVEREKRRRKVLVQQLTAHHALQVRRSCRVLSIGYITTWSTVDYASVTSHNQL